MAGSHETLGTGPTRSRSSSSSTLNSASHLSNIEPRRPGTARSTGGSNSRTIQNVSHIGGTDVGQNLDDQSVLHSSNATEHGAAVLEHVTAQGGKNRIQLGLEAVKDPKEQGIDLEKGIQPTSSPEKSNSPQQDSKLVSLCELIRLSESVTDNVGYMDWS